MIETGIVLCPTETQVRAVLETARTASMSHVERVICEDAFILVSDAVARNKVSWAEVMWDPHYAVVQVFDDYFFCMGLTEEGGIHGESEELL